MQIVSFLTPKTRTFFLNMNSTIRQALEKMDEHKFGVIPLIDDQGKYVTTVSEGDLLRFIKNNANFNLQVAQTVRLSEVDKHRTYEALPIFATEQEVFEKAQWQNFVPIVDDRGMFIGIVTRQTLMEYFLKSKK